MMKKAIIISAFIILLLLLSNNAMAENSIKEIENLRHQFKKIVNIPIIRVDGAGDGNFGKVRIGHAHNGIDLLVNEGQLIYSPINAKIIRVAYPYANDKSLEGFLIKGTGLFSEVEIKVFYAKLIVNVGDEINAGEPLAKAQDVTKKYPNQGMKNHIHIEMYIAGKLINPTKFFV